MGDTFDDCGDLSKEGDIIAVQFFMSDIYQLLVFNLENSTI